jgi:hypothetical protein
MYETFSSKNIKEICYLQDLSVDVYIRSCNKELAAQDTVITLCKLPVR